MLWNRFVPFRSVLILAVVLMAGLIGTNSARSDDDTHVYMFRGIINVFSLGLDEIAENLRKRGVKVTVLNHLSSSQAYNEILAGGSSRRPGTRPLVLVGHSLGANAALALSKKLAEKNIKVNLVITLDPTASGPLSSNVGRYINYHFGDVGLRGYSDTPEDLRRRVQNINLNRYEPMGDETTSHFVMTSHNVVQKDIAKSVLRYVR